MAKTTTGAAQPQVSTRSELVVNVSAVDFIPNADGKFNVQITTRETFAGIRLVNGVYTAGETNVISFSKGYLISMLADVEPNLAIIAEDNKEYNAIHKADEGFVAKTIKNALLGVLLRGSKLKIIRDAFVAGETYVASDGETRTHEYDGFHTTIVDGEFSKAGSATIATLAQNVLLG